MEFVRLADLEDYDLILPSVGLQARSAFENIVSDRNLNLKIAIESNEVNTILNLLRKSNYVTVSYRFYRFSISSRRLNMR